MLARCLRTYHRFEILPTVISFHPTHSFRGRRAFSLVELLVIIVLISVLLVAGVGVLGDSGYKARRAGADMLTGMIEQARTTAITSRSHVILAIAEPGDLPAGDTRGRLGLFRVESWPEAADGEIPAVLINRWRPFRDGVVLLGGVAGGDAANLPNPMDSPKLGIRYGGPGGNRTIQVHALVFNPRGSLHYPTGSSPVIMRIAEGGYRDGVATPNRRGDSQAISENRIRIGRVTARPLRIDG